MMYNSLVNSFRKNILQISLASLALVLPAISLAQGITSGPCIPATSGQICNPIPSVADIPSLIQKVLIGVLQIGMPIVTVAVIYSGFLFVKAQGNSEKLNEAKRALLYTLIGAAVLLGSWAIATLISTTVLAL